jgi:hypothetical protein
MYNFLTRNGLCNFHNRASFLWRQQFPKQFTKREFYLCLVLAELAILQTIIIRVKTTWAYQVQDNWNLNTTIANHLDQSLWLHNQKQGQTVRSHSLHSSLAYAQLCCTFYQPQKWTIKTCRSKTIFLSQTKHYHMAQFLWPCNQTQIILLSWPF